MEEENIDQVPEETTEETTEEVVTEEVAPEEQSEKTEEEPITVDKTYELAQALQKGYTLTRQELSEIKKNQEAINEALKGINKSNEFQDDDAPLTVKGFLKLQDEQRRVKLEEDQKVNRQIDSQLDELKARGIIQSKADEDAVIEYAISQKKQGKNKDLMTAGLDWKDLQEAKREGGKVIAKVKTQVKQEAGSQVGTSQKSTGTEQGFDYSEIRNKSFDELSQG